MMKHFLIWGIILLTLCGGALGLAHYIRPLGNPPQPYVRYSRIAIDSLQESRAQTAQSILAGQPGVRAVQANCEAGIVAVAFEAGATKPTQLLQALQQAGIPGNLQEDVAGKCPVPHHWLLQYRSWFNF